MRRWSLLSASSFALLVGTAHAAPPDDASSPGADVAEAPARDEFERGKIALDEGRWAEACALFESSVRRFPSSSAELKIASCREHDGRLVEAVRAYEAVLGRNDAAAPSERREKIRAWCEARLAELRPRLAWLRVAFATPAAQGEVRCDGEALARTRGDARRALDPGSHRLEILVPGRAPRSAALSLREGETHEVVVRVEPDDASSAAPAPPHPAPPRAMTAAGVVVGGSGVVLVGVATALALHAARTRDDASPWCAGVSSCVGPGEDLRASAARDERLSIGLAATGLAAVGVGAWLLWGSTRAGERSVAVGLGPGRVSAEATW